MYKLLVISPKVEHNYQWNRCTEPRGQTYSCDGKILRHHGNT